MAREHRQMGNIEALQIVKNKLYLAPKNDIVLIHCKPKNLNHHRESFSNSFIITLEEASDIHITSYC